MPYLDLPNMSVIAFVIKENFSLFRSRTLSFVVVFLVFNLECFLRLSVFFRTSSFEE